MTPPLTGFFMRAVGLGQMHKEIERQKRGGNVRPRNRRLSISHIDQPYKTWSSSPRMTNGPPPPSPREIVRGIDGSPPFPRVHRDDVSDEALDDYNLDWTYDPSEKGYIIIEKHLTRQELQELLQHAAGLRERKERVPALRESEMEAERETNLRRSKERSDPRQDSETGRERLAERTLTRDGRNGLARQEALTSHPIAEFPSPSITGPQRPRAPSTHSRLSRPFDPHDFTPREQARQIPPQAHGLRSPSRAPRAPSELPMMPSRRARDTHNPMARSPSVQQGSRPYEEVPSARPAGRAPRAPSELAFTPSGHAREPYDPRARPPSVEQDPRPFTGAPNIRPAGRRLSHMRSPSEDGQFVPPSFAESLAGARVERPRQAAGNAREVPLQHARGSIPPRRERSPHFAPRGSESRRAESRAPGPRVEGRNDMGRRNSVRGYRAI